MRNAICQRTTILVLDAFHPPRNSDELHVEGGSE
jgi:hypothetical protein